MSQMELLDVWSCPMDEAEQDFAAHMMALTGITSEANLLRLGLWHLAKHLDVPVGEAFMLRKPRGRCSRKVPA